MEGWERYALCGSDSPGAGIYVCPGGHGPVFKLPDPGYRRYDHRQWIRFGSSRIGDLRRLYHPVLAVFAAMAAGACAWLCDGVFADQMGVPSILAGIITNTGLYTVNLMVMGWSSNVSLLKAGYHVHTVPGPGDRRRIL